MTTTRQSITRQDHPEAFAPYHAVSDALSQSHGRYGPPSHLPLPRFSDPHSAMLVNQGSINDISYNRHPGAPHMSGSSYPFNFPTATPIPRPSFPHIGSPALWSSAPPPIRQAAPLPPAQGYGMGQDPSISGGQAKRRRINGEGTPASTSISSNSSGSLSESTMDGPAVATHPRGKEAHHNNGSLSYERIPHELTEAPPQSQVSVSTYDHALSDPLLGDPESGGVSEWAGVGDFALFNEMQNEMNAETTTSSEWSAGYIPFGEDDGGGVASSNNLFDLKEDTLFPSIDRTTSAPASNDLSLRAYGSKSPQHNVDCHSDSGVPCMDKFVPAVATGRPLQVGLSDSSAEGPLPHAVFPEAFPHNMSDLTKMRAANGDDAVCDSLSGALCKFDMKVEEQRRDKGGTGTTSSPSLAHSSKLTESELCGGASSDASTAPSVSDYGGGLIPMGCAGPMSSGSCGNAEMKSNGKLIGTYARSNGEASKYNWRSVERANSDTVNCGGAVMSNEHAHRPDLSLQTLEELNDISCFKNDERYKKLIVDYTEGISFPLGEGGRELLRACLNVKGCKGRQLQGASVPALLALAKNWGLWDVAIRIKVERSCGQLCPQHDAFVKFKANQSQMRKYVKKEYMVTERDNQGCLSGIIYDERRKITLGKEGRESLRTQLRRLHDKHAGKMDDLLEKHGFKYSELRNATVQQLSRMAYVCNLWDKVVAACRKQEEKRDYRNRDGNRSSTRNMKEYHTPSGPDHLSYAPVMHHQSDPTQRIPPGLGDAWKAAYPSDLQSYGDLPANAYETDDGSSHVETRLDDGDPNAPSSDYQSSYPGHPTINESKGSEVRVKREIADEPSSEGDKRAQKPALSIEDLLSTLTVNWESPTSESIERFLQRQQEGHDTPVTEDNIFQAFSDLVPTMNGSEVHHGNHHMGGRHNHQETLTSGVNLGLENGTNVICNDENLGNAPSTETADVLYDNTQQNLFLNDLI